VPAPDGRPIIAPHRQYLDVVPNCHVAPRSLVFARFRKGRVRDVQRVAPPHRTRTGTNRKQRKVTRCPRRAASVLLNCRSLQAGEYRAGRQGVDPRAEHGGGRLGGGRTPPPRLMRRSVSALQHSYKCGARSYKIADIGGSCTSHRRSSCREGCESSTRRMSSALEEGRLRRLNKRGQYQTSAMTRSNRQRRNESQLRAED